MIKSVGKLCAGLALIAATASIAKADAFTPASSETPEGIQKSRAQLLKSLQGQKYFREGTCRDVLNTALAMLKMPAVGVAVEKRSPASVSNRSRENDAVPVIKEKQDATASHPVTTKLETSKVGADRFEVKISRKTSSNEPVELNTTIAFETKKTSTDVQCEMKEAKFESRMPASAKPESAMTNDCLDVFIIDQASANPKIAEWVQRDCSFALHYLSPKTIAAAGAK